MEVQDKLTRLLCRKNEAVATWIFDALWKAHEVLNEDVLFDRARAMSSAYVSDIAKPFLG